MAYYKAGTGGDGVGHRVADFQKLDHIEHGCHGRANQQPRPEFTPLEITFLQNDPGYRYPDQIENTGDYLI